MRSENCLEWSDQDWIDFRTENYDRLGPEVRAEAVAHLRRELPAELLADLKARIEEDPAHWMWA